MTSVPCFAQWPYDCIEEDELEQDTGSQPSMSEWLFSLHNFTAQKVVNIKP